MKIEFHDGYVNNLLQGTLCAEAGKDGTIEYAYQAEIWVQDILQDPSPITRAFLVDYGKDYATVYAVYRRDPDGKLCCVGKRSDYDSEWRLPYSHLGATTIVTALGGNRTDENLIANMEKWAADQLKGIVSCAVLLDEYGIVAAWERGNHEPVLIARGPRVFQLTPAEP